MSGVNRFANTLLSAYILTFFSEWMFWSGRPYPHNYFAEAAMTMLFYAFILYFFLSAVNHFHAERMPALFLAGALYGWLLEGVIVQTMYDSFPLQISFTGLAWHALFSVLIGWKMLPEQLSQSRGWRLAAYLGLGLGVWSLTWWTETEYTIAHPLAVWGYNLVFALPLVWVYPVWSRVNQQAFLPQRREFRVMAALLVAYFVIVTVPLQPLALIVLPPLLWLILAALNRHRRQHADEPRPPRPIITFRQALPVLLIPILASTVYSVFWFTEGRWQTSIPLYIVTMPLGFWLLGRSLSRIFRQPVPTQTTP